MQTAPQSFGQSFSSSSVLGPNGEVVGNSVYVDSDGNRVINGIKYPTNAGGSAASELKAKPSPSQSNTVSIVARPDWHTEQVRPGAYVADNRGKYKGN